MYIGAKINSCCITGRGTWGEMSHWRVLGQLKYATGESWDRLNIKIHSLPLDVLSYVLTELDFRETCRNMQEHTRITTIIQAVCDVTNLNTHRTDFGHDFCSVSSNSY